MRLNAQHIEALANEHPRQGEYSYGTAGFRTKAERLPSTVLRMGMFAAVRAATCAQASGKSTAVGVMITASHNQHADNGIKLADPSGEMMRAEWESLATGVANAPEQQLSSVLQSILLANGVTEEAASDVTVVVGHDTRAHSPRLADLCRQGAEALGARVLRFDRPCSTPQLHWAVRQLQHCLGDEEQERKLMSNEAYSRTLSQAFLDILNLMSPSADSLGTVVIDCANGVGGNAFGDIAPLVSEKLQMQLVNLPDPEHPEKVNDGCGSEHVQKARTLPVNVTGEDGARYASCDGDADRLVYFAASSGSSSASLVDGDRELIVFTCLLRSLLSAANLTDRFTVGVVQTAYANGASTHFVQRQVSHSAEMLFPVACYSR
ncbi:MAG: hypothetical protein MHM6MM_008320 [Cercozoa sp. M6MM]